MPIHGACNHYRDGYVHFMDSLQDEKPEDNSAFSLLPQLPPVAVLFPAAVLPPPNDSSDFVSISHGERHYCVLCKKTKTVLTWHHISSDPDVYHCGRCHSKIDPKGSFNTRKCVFCKETKRVVRWRQISSNPDTYCCGNCNDNRGGKKGTAVKRAPSRKYCVICKEWKTRARWENPFHKDVANVCGYCADKMRHGSLSKPVLSKDILV
ncbi:MAG TPA: hypothetical protein VLE95_05775 [Chlamydiales bacterium]|nr:hypothetical protein [Chlamydiales bacterium]